MTQENAGVPDETAAAEPALRLSILVAQAIQPVPFEKIEVSLHVAGVTADHTDAEIEALVARSHFVVRLMAERMAKIVRRARRDRGWDGLAEPEETE